MEKENKVIDSRTCMFLGILFGNFIVFPFYSAIYDEIISFACLIFIFVNKKSRQKIWQAVRNLKWRKPQVLLLLLLISNAALSFLMRHDQESLKWLLFYSLLAMVYLALCNFKLLDIDSKFLFLGFCIYATSIVLTYYISEIVIGVPFFENQSHFMSGTTTYMTTILVLSFCINYWLSVRKILSSVTLFTLAYWSVHISASRTGLIAIFTLIIATILSRRIKWTIKLFATTSFIVCLIVTPKVNELILFKTNTIIQKPSPISIVESPRDLSTNIFTTYYESAKFFFNPRESDQDRHSHFSCIFQEFNELDWLGKFFGLGPSQHRRLVGECLSGDSTSYTRSISAARIILDNGLIGATLYLLCFLSVLVRYMNERNYYAGILTTQFMFGNYLQDQGNLILVWLSILSVNLFQRKNIEL